MTKKILRTLCIGLPLLPLLLAYLGLVPLWMLAVVDDDVAAYPPALYANALAPAQQELLLKIEDATFFSHAGVSLANSRGVTTVTSSLARKAFLFHAERKGVKGVFQSFYRAVFNCCRKVDLGRDVMALVLNAHLDKRHQLALYAQEVYMGRAQGKQVKGLAQAASVYLGKPLAQARAAEFAGLVGMIQAPNLYNPLSNRAAFDQRAARVAAVATGRCVPDGWRDTGFEHCAP